MKKLFALLMAMIMVFSLATVAFAAGNNTYVSVDYAITNEAEHRDGTITIRGVSTENVYAIYKMLHLESYVEATGVYSYKVVDKWVNFFKDSDVQAYMTVDESGYATWIGEDTETRKIAFSKLALAYAKNTANGIQPVKVSSTAGNMTVTGTDGTFSNLTLGYYLVDSTMGALCGLTTTNPNAYITAKNAAPTIDKQVMEDSTSQWGGSNTADIGQVVNFRVTINVHGGAENYVLHDKTENYFIMYGNTVPDDVKALVGVKSVKHVVPGATAGTTTETEAPAKYYTVVKDPSDGCAFHVVFNQEFCDHLKTNDKVVVSYDAMLSRNAVIAGSGSPNIAWLDFGEDHKTEEDITYTKTYGFEIVKTDDQNKFLNGAAFRVYDAATGGNEIGVILMDDSKAYRRARSDEQDDELHSEIVVGTGMMKVVGFDNGTYYLEETDTPLGYNQLSSRQAFTISDDNLYAQYENNIYFSGSGVHVVNKTGSMLPETGDIGTTLFITFGMFVVLGTGVLLVTKKRMSMIED